MSGLSSFVTALNYRRTANNNRGLCSDQVQIRETEQQFLKVSAAISRKTYGFGLLLCGRIIIAPRTGIWLISLRILVTEVLTEIRASTTLPHTHGPSPSTPVDS